MAARSKRADGRYAVTATLDGERLFFYGKTQAEAKRKRHEARERARSGAPVREASRPLREWVAEWETTHAKINRKRTTQDNYSTLLTGHVLPVIGDLPLSKLRATDVVRVLARMEEGGMAGSTRRSAYAALRAVLDAAVADRLIRENPAALVKRPSKGDVRESRALTPVEVQQFLTGTKGLRYATAYRLALGTGLRRAELTGLRWEDLDLSAATLTVAHNLVRVRREGSVASEPDRTELAMDSPKTRNSRRTIPLSAGLVTLLKEHKSDQNSERLAAGDLWHDSGHVFTTSGQSRGVLSFGRPADPANLSRGVRMAVRKAGLSDVGGKIGLHTLRHTFATVKLSQGVPVHVVSRMLGHSSIAVTVDIYGHLTDDGMREAMEAGSAALGF